MLQRPILFYAVELLGFFSFDDIVSVTILLLIILSKTRLMMLEQIIILFMGISLSTSDVYLAVKSKLFRCKWRET